MVKKNGTQGTPPDAATTQENQPKKSKKKLLIISGLALALLSGGGFGAWHFLHNSGDSKSEKAAKPEAEKAPIFMALETFTVNLQPTEIGEQFLQISITVQFGDQEDADRVKAYTPQIRSQLLFLLTSKRADELSIVEGKQRLTEEIKELLSKPLTPQGKKQNVKDVFFTSFVIQ